MSHYHLYSRHDWYCRMQAALVSTVSFQLNGLHDKEIRPTAKCCHQENYCNQTFATLSGKIQAQEIVIIRDLWLLQFDKNRHISQQKAMVFDNDKVKYDIILGTNFLSKVGIKLNYSEGKMEWIDCFIPLHPQEN